MPRLATASLISLAATAFSPAIAEAAMPLTGVWARDDGIAHVRIAPCGQHFCATNVWVKPGRKTEAVGDTLVMMVKPEGEARYSGKAFDKRRKLTLTMSIDVKPDSLTSHGCVLGGILCKSVNWQRLDD